MFAPNQTKIKILIEQALNRLEDLMGRAPGILKSLDEQVFSQKPSANRWSKKEILGHLIDSATNNHQRFIRGQFEAVPDITYDQNNWVEYSCYQTMDTHELIEFWTVYNRQLKNLIQRMPQEVFSRQVKRAGEITTLEFLVLDYVAHMEHHLKQIVGDRPF